MKVTVIDYGLSNLLSVRHAFAHFGAETLLTSDPADVLAALKPGEECYFIHSYEAKPVCDEDRLADTVYGGREICAAASHGSVLGCQFHPEKSGVVGLKIIEEFLK